MYANLDTAGAIKSICEIGNAANLFYQEQAPWGYLKGESANVDKARAIVTACAEVVRMIAIALKPVVPDFSAKVFEQLGLGDQNLADLDKGLGDGNVIAHVEKTYIRPERAEFDALTIPEEKQEEKGVTEEAVKQTIPGEEKGGEDKVAEIVRTPLKPLIEFDDFEKLDIRVGKVIVCEKVKKSNKLLRLEVEIGHPDGPVQILSGLAKHYQPEALIGRNVLVITNLKPREMFGMMSNGMVLAASDELGLELPTVLLRAPGSQVK